MATIETRNPTNGELIKTYDEMSMDQMASIIDEVNEKFQVWKQQSFKNRGTLMQDYTMVSTVYD